MKKLMKNKRGNVFFGVVLGIIIFIFGTLFTPYITDNITTSRTDLNCSDSSNITGGNMLVCLLVDTVAPYFIWFFISVAVGFIGGKA